MEDFNRDYDARFNFEILDGVFDAFLSTASAIIPKLNDISVTSTMKAPIVFTYDGLDYLGTVQTGPHMTKSKVIARQLILRLTNDGFVYAPSNNDNVRIYADAKRVGLRHDSDTWCMLDRSELRKFSKLVQFVHHYFEVAGATVFYNYESMRLDVSACDKNDNVVKICFEKSQPRSKFEDEWMEPLELAESLTEANGDPGVKST